MAYLQTTFLAEVEQHFGRGADPDYYQINHRMLHGEKAKGYGMTCPRDGRKHCSYVDAVGTLHSSRATVMLSWSWANSVRTIIGALTLWCERSGRNPADVYVWQCALCNNQFRVEEKKANKEWEAFETFEKIFSRRVRTIRHVLAILSPWQRPQYLDRIWCVFECHNALHTEGCKLEVLLSEKDEVEFREALEDPSRGMKVVWNVFKGVKIQRARATVDADRRNILRLVDPDCEEQGRSYEASMLCADLNVEVVGRLRSWLIEAVAGAAECQLSSGRVDSFVSCRAAVELLVTTVSDWPRATSIFNRATQADEKAARKPGYVELVRTYAQCLEDANRDLDAHDAYDRARSAMKKAGSLKPEDSVLLLINKGKALGRLGEKNHAGAMELFKQASASLNSLCQGESGEPIRGIHLGALAEFHWNAGNESHAEQLFIQARDEFDVVGDRHKKHLAELLVTMARCSGKTRPLWAMQRYEEAKGILRGQDMQATPEFAKLLLRMGACARDRKALGEALNFYEEARQAFTLAGARNTVGYATLLRSMGVLFGVEKQNDVAMGMFKASQHIFVAVGAMETCEYALLLECMYWCWSKEGQKDEAKAYYNQSERVRARLARLGICKAKSSEKIEDC